MRAFVLTMLHCILIDSFKKRDHALAGVTERFGGAAARIGGIAFAASIALLYRWLIRLSRSFASA